MVIRSVTCQRGRRAGGACLLIRLALVLAFRILPVQGLTDEEARAVQETVFQPYTGEMPSHFFTQTVRQRLKASGDAGGSPIRLGDPERAAGWMAIPEKRWDDIIGASAPMAMRYVKGTCPYCAKPFVGVTCDVTTDPGIGRTICCKRQINAEGLALQADDRARPNTELQVPHLDGSVMTYRFHVSPGAEGRDWYSPEGELQWARLCTVIYTVLPDLEAALLLRGEGRAARALAKILDRLAEVYPGWPYVSCEIPQGFARTADLVPGDRNGDYITAESWAAELKRRATARDILSDWDLRRRHSKFPYPWGYRSDGLLIPCGIVAQAFELGRTHAEFRRFSLQRYGDEDALESRVRDRVFREMALVFALKKPTLINMMSVWGVNAAAVAVAARNPDLHRKVVTYLDTFIYNHHFPDGMSTEGSFNYSAMMGPVLGNRWLLPEVLGADIAARHPLVKRIRQLGDYPVRTLLGTESMHGDEHAAFMTSRHFPVETDDPTSPVSESMSFPFYGLTCLRAGRPGRRLEVVLDYQNQIMHAHRGRFGLQAFYQGVNLFPDIGYGSGTPKHDGVLTDAHGKTVRFDSNGRRLAGELEMHCTGAVDGSQFDRWTFVFRRFLGSTVAGPEPLVRFVDVDGTPTYSSHPRGIDRFTRQLALCESSDGTPFLVDVFRMRGGRRHDMYWHVPGETHDLQGVVPEEPGQPNVYDWYAANADPPPGYLKETEFLYRKWPARRPGYKTGMKKVHLDRVGRLVGNTWSARWQIDPRRFLFGSNPAQEALFPPVTVRVNSFIRGNEAAGGTRLIEGACPWYSNVVTPDATYFAGIDDALRTLFVTRQGRRDDLESTFVTVLQPRTAEQSPALARCTPLTGTPDSSSVLRCTLQDGKTMLLAIGESGEAGFESDAFAFSARLAAVVPSTDELTLLDGTLVEVPGLRLEAAPTARLRLVKAVGDISGDRSESALIVESSSSLPKGYTLRGMTITVEHRTSRAHVSAYEVDRIVSIGEGLWRIELLHTPPFIEGKFYVTAYDPSRPKVVRINMRLFVGVGRPHGLGRMVCLPKAPFTSSVQSHVVQGYTGWWSRGLVLSQAPPAGAVQVGDPLVIYAIQPGDTVVVPSLVICRRVDAQSPNPQLDIYASVDAKLSFGTGPPVAIRPGRTRLPAPER